MLMGDKESASNSDLEYEREILDSSQTTKHGWAVDFKTLICVYLRQTSTWGLLDTVFGSCERVLKLGLTAAACYSRVCELLSSLSSLGDWENDSDDCLCSGD